MISSPMAPDLGLGWSAVYQRSIDTNHFDPVDLSVDSVRLNGSVVEVVVNLDRAAGIFGNGPFKPDVWVYTVLNSNNPTQLGFYNQYCSWAT